MERRKLKGVLIGFVFGVVVVTAYISNYVLSLEKLSSARNKKDLDVEITEVASSVSLEKDIVKANNTMYKNISFDTVEDFISSANCLFPIKEISNVVKSKVYDFNGKDIVTVYENEEGNIRITLLDEGEILNCKFLGVTDEESEIVESVMDKSITEYCFKNINNGFILEKDTVA